MKRLAFEGARRGKRCRTTIPDTAAERPMDLVQRRFIANLPNQLWVADITYVTTGSGIPYIAFVKDVFARRNVGWKVARSMRSDPVLDPAEQAVWAHGATQGVIHHSDPRDPISVDSLLGATRGGRHRILCGQQGGLLR